MKKLSKSDFFKFEKEDMDFPFYNNVPKLSSIQWFILAISSIITILLVLTHNYIVGNDISRVLYFLIPFLGFGIVANWKYDLICKKFKRSDFKLIIILIILQLVFTILVNNILLYVFNMNAQVNPAISQLGSVLFWVLAPLQIFGEELMKIIPFLIFLTVFYKITKNRKTSIIISTIIVLLMFGIMHIPVYDNLFIAIISIGMGSIFTMYAYLKTKNIFVSFLVHFLIDLFAFSVSLLVHI